MKSSITQLIALAGLLLGTGVSFALDNGTLVTVKEEGFRAGVQVICESTAPIPQCNAGTMPTRQTTKLATFQCRAANVADMDKLKGKEADLSYTKHLSVAEACV